MGPCPVCRQEYRVQPHVCKRRVGPHGEIHEPFVPAPNVAPLEVAEEPESKQGRVTSTSPPAPAAEVKSLGLGLSAAGPFSKPRAATKKVVAQARKKPTPKKAPVVKQRRAPAKGKK